MDCKPSESAFRNFQYLRMNARRLEHLASLGLPIAGREVLEVGAGIGDLTSFFLDRGCSVTAIEPRPETGHASPPNTATLQSWRSLCGALGAQSVTLRGRSEKASGCQIYARTEIYRIGPPTLT